MINLNDDQSGGLGLFRVDNTSNGGIYQIPGRQFISGSDNVDDNNIAYIARTRVFIENPGDYTFGVHSDDGFQLTIAPADSGAPLDWASVSGSGNIAGGTVLNFPTGTGDSNTRGVINLPFGYYDIEMRGWEGGGGAYTELYSAPGAFANDGDTTLWALVGQNPVANYPGIGAAGWGVEFSAAGGAGLSSIATAEADFAGGIDASALGISAINFNGGGLFGGDTAYPSFGGGDNFAMRATGELVIPEDGSYIFGFQGDDGGYLEILDLDGNTVPFRSIGDDADNASALVNGRLEANYNTGNSRTTGLINLVEGSYTINGLFWEAGSGDNFEIWGGPEGAPLSLLTQNGAGLRAIQGGLQIAVPEPSRALLVILGAIGLIARRRR
ncbi:MAG: PA14 domain-containing protein [Verrucomicrobiales bacterium]